MNILLPLSMGAGIPHLDYVGVLKEHPPVKHEEHSTSIILLSSSGHQVHHCLLPLLIRDVDGIQLGLIGLVLHKLLLNLIPALQFL